MPLTYYSVLYKCLIIITVANYKKHGYGMAIIILKFHLLIQTGKNYMIIVHVEGNYNKLNRNQMKLYAA